ncbi:hypothetical protein S40285_09218 [Stachybotrys chlorohalonatus IBT 40285]|uniref:Rhodanese domain-containing protein n=1 Tax=Stachybotrys chlorohalonatus (strain IBT 40285) TaxID=1283841 RepID=A0A084QWU3_STAC4|nr:hypothetical protein S40285_09218 [Stachybotrys chlorohalonata IBT 40285]
MPSEGELFLDLGANGFTTKKNVVIITSTAELPVGVVRATRTATTLEYAGHDIMKVGILDGGFEAWNRIGGPIDALPVIPTPAKYYGSVDESFIVDRAYVNSSLSRLEDGIVLVDARPSSAYTDGNIESALSIPLASILEANGAFRSAAELLATFESAVGGAPVSATNEEVIVYCWIGLMATGWHYTLTNIPRFGNVKLYDESVEDWVKKYPLVLG